MLSSQSQETNSDDDLTLPLNYGVGAMLTAMETYEVLVKCINDQRLIEAEMQLRSAKQSYEQGMRWYSYAMQEFNDPAVSRKSPEHEFIDYKRVADGILEWLNNAEARIKELIQASKPLRRASTISSSTTGALAPISEKMSEKTECKPSIEISVSSSTPPPVTVKPTGISSRISFFEKQGPISAPNNTTSPSVPPPLPISRPRSSSMQANIANLSSVLAPAALSRVTPPPLPRTFSLSKLKESLPSKDNQDSSGGPKFK